MNLDSGQHRLEVRARDQAFNVDPTPDAIDFEVIPPVWQQGWFIGLLLVWIGLLGFLLRMLMRTRERHLLEQQQARELHLQELDRMKTGFFTNISHELRTPITVIQGRLDRLMSDEKDEDRKQSLVTLQRNARRVATLVTQLLDFRKIEEGKLAMEASVGDLAASVREWVESLQPLAELSQSTCILECVPECRGRFDFDKLQKIVTNLVSNSIKYTQAAGTVRVMLQARAEDRVVRFIVEDDGIGISAEHLPHIFERFYRVPESSMAVGAGIGLNLTQELVSLLGGDIRVESPIHHDSKRPGTRFTVTLPMEPVNDKPVELEQPNLQVVSPASPEATDESFLLVVEDDEDIRQLLKEGLSSLYRVEIAENGAIGLQLAKERVPDLIISDVMMPVMDGVTLCRHVKASMETSHIPVILLTAKSSLEYQMEGLKTGADDYVIKPFSMDLLLVRIANLLESRRHLREKFGRDFAVVPRILPDDAPDKEFLDKAMRVLEEHSSNWEFKTEQFADELHMSLRSLQRKIKAVTNRSPKEFINDFRMARAAERLIQTSDTIAEISFQVGMDEPTNFTRLFKTQYQMTPTEYRAQNKSS
ncbi:MAG: response regulator [Kiritimatiellaceae bacterium]|nr:response regulator [Kiritimatiellaceae bacterium]